MTTLSLMSMRIQIHKNKGLGYMESQCVIMPINDNWN